MVDIYDRNYEQFLAEELASFVPEGGFLQRYVDEEGVEVLTLSEAVTALIRLTRHDPEFHIRAYAKIDEHPLSQDVRRWCWRDCEALGIEVDG